MMSKNSIESQAYEKINADFHTLFNDAREEIFEYGVKTEFSTQLTYLISLYGEKAITALADLLHSEHATIETQWEALRWLGKIDDPFTRQARRRLLERSLESSLARLRDGALQGLASMDDPDSIPSLKVAIEQEAIPELHEDMLGVLQQLEETLLENSQSAVSA
jgi:hypothetical protein